MRITEKNFFENSCGSCTCPSGRWSCSFLYVRLVHGWELRICHCGWWVTIVLFLPSPLLFCRSTTTWFSVPLPDC